MRLILPIIALMILLTSCGEVNNPEPMPNQPLDADYIQIEE